MNNFPNNTQWRKQLQDIETDLIYYLYRNKFVVQGSTQQKELRHIIKGSCYDGLSIIGEAIRQKEY